MTVEIRRATEQDLEDIMAIEKSCFQKDAWSKSVMRSELLAPHTYYLIAEENQTPVGYAGLSKVSSSSSADIQTIAVSNEFRGKGIGKLLMQRLISKAEGLAADEIYLEVREDRPIPQNLYLSLGFEKIDRRENYYQPEGIAAIIMKLVLEPNAAEPLVLGIETSCDETGIGIVRGTTLLANVISSSMDQHARFGGVVPEIAARAHLEAIEPTLKKALSEAKISLDEIDAVAVTNGPGLAGLSWLELEQLKHWR